MRNGPQLRVLLIEDDAGDAGLLQAMFSKEMPGQFQLTRVALMREAERHLRAAGADVILLDLGLPDARGLDTLRRARVAAPRTAIIVLSGLQDEGLATAALQEGAQDYLIKGQVESRALPRALRHNIEFQRLTGEAGAARQQQLELRDEFLSHVSHELRGPLTSIYSFTTLVADGLAGETTTQQDEYLGWIVRSTQQLHGMIEDLLEETQSRAAKLEGDAKLQEAGGAEVPERTAAVAVAGETAPPSVSSGRPSKIEDNWQWKVGGVF